jgi:hypothetical protein
VPYQPNMSETVTIHLDNSQRVALDQEAKGRGISPMEALKLVINVGIDAALTDRAEQSVSKPALVPEFNSGHRRLAQITPHHHLERYLGFAISERLRQDLEDLIGAHRGLDEEATWARLLELGLSQVETDPSLLDPKPTVGPEDGEERNLRAEVHHHLQAMRQRARSTRSR